MAGPEGVLGIITEIDVDVAVRDGTKLRANVWRPDAEGRFPSLLMRTPYGKPQGGLDRYVRAGYAVVAQDVRGRYASEGDYVPYTDPGNSEAEDGYDSVEWLAEQPWCNGRVGTTGTSYPAWLQWTLAKLRPPHLVAMAACSIPLENTDVDWWGAFRPGRRIMWWLTTMAPDLRRRAGLPPPHTPAEAREIWHEIEHGSRLSLLPWIEVVTYLPPPLNRYVEDWLRNPGRKCWRFADTHAEVDVPNLDFTGWFDHCNSLGHLPGMQQHARTERARTQTRVVVGPWAHHTLGKRECHGVDFGPLATVDIDGMKIRWFDRWLKGIDNGMDREPPVRYFVMGSQVWKNAPTWPPPNTVPTAYHLAGAGDAGAAEGTGRLAPEPGCEEGSDTYTYDPRDPVPTLWTRNLMAGASDRRRLDYRQDILRYRTPRLTRPLEVAGCPEVILYARSSAPDTDFFARLVDEYPDGPALEISYGMVRARHRKSLDAEQAITPGEIVEYRIRLGPTACRFEPGHRVRLEITSSDFPNFDRNHNVGRNDLTDSVLAVAAQEVLHGRSHPSRLVLPVDESEEASSGKG